MVRVSSQQGFLFKIWRFLLVLWEILMLFLSSICKKNPMDVTKADATPFKTTPYRGSGGGGGGGGPPGRPNDGYQRPPGDNIRSLPKYRGVMRMPMGGGG